MSTLRRRVEMLEEQIRARHLLSTRAAARDLPFSEWLPLVSPHRQWDVPHLIHVREHLDRIASGEIKRLMVFMPPRHGKSELATVHFSAWSLETWPHKRVILGSYSSTLAERFSRQARRICERRMLLAADRKAVNDWETSIGGGMRAVGVGGGVTGHGGDLIIIDDPIRSREEANSSAYRERVWAWWTDDLSTRQEPGAAVILILTRWHEDDLAGRILASDSASEWTVIRLPALAEADDPLQRVEGEALWPERYDEAALERQRTENPSSFQALYQQRPSALEGSIFKREWWRYYSSAPSFTRIVQSWDTAFKAGADNDFSVCTTWGETTTGFYLLDVWKRRVEFPTLKATAVALADQYRPAVVLVEDKASGQSLLQELQRDTRLPVRPVKVDHDKISRAYAVTPSIEAGRVFLPESASWLADYLDGMASFPNAAHDDEVDSTTQALNYMIGRDGSMGLFHFYRDLAEQTARERAAVGPTVRLRLPPGVAGPLLIDGTLCQLENDGTVAVPREHAQGLINGGFTCAEAVPTP